MPRKKLAEVYFNRRMAALVGVGFAAGLPSAYQLLGSTIQAWLGTYDIDITTIGLFSLITLPVAFNFLWAPLLDRFPPPVFASLGQRRGWLMILQLLLAAGIVAMAFAGPTSSESSVWPLAIAGFVVAFLLASHDVVADAYRTDVLPDQELGVGAAVYVTGYRFGLLVAGGGALYLSQDMSWRHVYMFLGMMMLPGICATLIGPEPPGSGVRPATLAEAVEQPLVDFFGRMGWGGIAILAFVILFKLPDSMANAMTIPFLQTQLGFDLRQIALAREWFGLGWLIVGAFVGGGITAQMGVRCSLLLFGILQALSNGGFLVLAVCGRRMDVLLAVVAVEKFCAGLVTAGFIAYLMSLCNRKYSATQYAMFTSLMYGAGAVVGTPMGYAVDSMGYKPFFAISIAIGLPAMLLLLWLPQPNRDRLAVINARESD